MTRVPSDMPDPHADDDAAYARMLGEQSAPDLGEPGCAECSLLRAKLAGLSRCVDLFLEDVYSRDELLTSRAAFGSPMASEQPPDPPTCRHGDVPFACELCATAAGGAR